MTPRRGTAVLHHLALGLAAVVYLAPVLFMVVASLKPSARVLADGASWRAFVPQDATTANYAAVLGESGFPGYLFNSLVITCGTVALGLVVNSMCGFALARLSWRGRDTIMLLVLALLVIPFEAIAIPLFVLAAHGGVTDGYAVQIAPFIANPFAIALFTTFFRALPAELDEAARIDGCSTWGIYWRIALPLSLPALASVGILTFLLQWGNYLWPLLVTTGPEVRPLPLAMGIYPAQHPVPWGEVMAFGTLMVLPVVIVFLAFQRAFVRGLSAAALKG